MDMPDDKAAVLLAKIKNETVKYAEGIRRVEKHKRQRQALVEELNQELKRQMDVETWRLLDEASKNIEPQLKRFRND
jgi:hypothetical protein